MTTPGLTPSPVQTSTIASTLTWQTIHTPDGRHVGTLTIVDGRTVAVCSLPCGHRIQTHTTDDALRSLADHRAGTSHRTGRSPL